MNRRRVIAGAIASLAATKVRIVAAQEATPDDDERIELAPGFYLRDARIDSIAGGSIPAFMGEYVNETGETFDSPVLGITFYDADENIVGSHYATPVLPISRDGARVPLTGQFYEFNPETDPYDSVQYTLCDSLDNTYYVDQAEDLDIELVDQDETLTDDSFLLEGKIANNGATPVEDVGVTVIFRDETDTFVGYCWDVADRSIPAGKTFAIEADVNVNSIVPFDPFVRAEGKIETQIVVGPFVGGYGINCG